MNPFDTTFFRSNRATLRTALNQDAPIVVSANGQLQASGDNPFPFNQDPNFWYLTGIELPDFILVLDKDGEYLISPSRSHVQDLFDGITSVEHLRKVSGIKTVLDPDEGWLRLKSSVKRYMRVLTPQANQSYLPTYGFYTNPARSRLINRVRRFAAGIEAVDIRPYLAKLRVVKQAPEIGAIKRSIAIAGASLSATMKNSYAYEYEAEADISHGFRWNGASGHSFSPIVAGGKNACILHYLTNNDALNPEDLILADIGALASNYSSDIARTWSQGKPTARQTAVWNAVNEAVEFGISQLKPGPTSFYEYEQNVREFIGEKLKELKLIKKIDKDGIYKYYPHAPHYLGLDVHDAGDYRQPVQAGMVMTIEPGIYIPDEGIGIRLEEDLLITENGCEVLSKACPRTLTPVQ